MTRRHVVFWPLAVAFGLGCLWWLVFIPRNTGRLTRAIPATATVVSAHHNLAGRWDSLSAHPLMKSVGTALGVKTEDWDALRNDAGFRGLLGRLASDDVVLAYVPAFRTTGRPGWVFASWLGGASQRFRWTLKAAEIPRLHRAASRNGWRVYVWAPRELPEHRVTFSLVEGMLVGVIAQEPFGIDEVLACVDGTIPSVADRPAWALAPPAPHADRGWYRPDPRAAPGITYRYGFTLAADGSLAGTVVSPYAVDLSAAPDAQGPSLAEFGQVLGDRAVALASIDGGYVRAWLDRTFTNRIAEEVARLIAENGQGSVGLAVLGVDYGGRLLSMRLPSVVAGIPTTSSVSAVRGIYGALDRLNAATTWGLVPQPVPAGDRMTYAIESTGESTYAKFLTGERLAFAPLSSSLLFASNLDGLVKLMGESDAATNASPSSLAAGLDAMARDGARAFLWLDLDRGRETLRLALTAWSLKLFVEDPKGSAPIRERINEVKAWADAMAPLDEMQVWLKPGMGTTVFDFRMGGP